MSPSNLLIYYDDLTDSDNWVAARFLQQAAAASPSTRVKWIVEPRQVSLGLDMTAEEINDCKTLLGKHFPNMGNPFKVLLGGLLEKSELDKVEGLTDDEKRILALAIKPKYGPKEDAILHGRLMAFDFLTSLGAWSDSSVDVFLDTGDMDNLENPVNLNMHHHEELVFRSRDELERHTAIMKEEFPQRATDLKQWYKECIDALEEVAAHKGDSVKDLDIDDLANEIKEASNVIFFGGSSLAILQRLIGYKDVAQNMQCYLQAGSFDLSKNLFPNQVNIALNPQAAKFVFSKFKDFRQFIIVPSSTTQIIKYSLDGLSWRGPTLEKRFLGYNCRMDPMKLATGEATIGDLRGKDFTMPDLTAFLCAFSAGFRGSSTLSYASLVDDGGALILKRHETGIPGIPVREIQNERSLNKTEVRQILSSLKVDWATA